jgi:hypothetical protein
LLTLIGVLVSVAALVALALANFSASNLAFSAAASAMATESIFSTSTLWLVYTQISPAIFIALLTTSSAPTPGWSIRAKAAAM